MLQQKTNETGKTLVIIIVIAVILIISGTVGFIVLKKPKDNGLAVPTSAAKTAILIPGYGGDQTSFTKIVQALRAKGIETKILDIGEGHGDINQYATMLQQVTEKSQQPVAWIGYSMGGLVARDAYTEDMYPLVSSISTWGSPLHGTEASNLATLVGACDTACSQMIPDSDFINNLPSLNANMAPWLSFYTPSDEIIRPYTSSELDGSHVTNIDLGECTPPVSASHGTLPDTATVINLTLKNVERLEIKKC